MKSYDEENENVDDEEGDDDGNVSDASQYAQYAQSAYPGETGCPLSIIPINKNTAEPPRDYSTIKKKKKTESDEEIYQRQYFLQNTKPLQRNPHNELSSLSFKTKQSVEIFPIPVIKTEKIDESYCVDNMSKDTTRIDHLPECEIQSVNVETKIKMHDATVDENYSKSHLELSMYFIKLLLN